MLRLRRKMRVLKYYVKNKALGGLASSDEAIRGWLEGASRVHTGSLGLSK